MILTKKKLRKEIEETHTFTPEMYDAVFDHITSTKGRLMWETELIKMSLKPTGELRAFLNMVDEAKPDIHADDHLHHTHNDKHAI